MRIRSIKPEFWRSDDIAALPISTRLTFIGLWSYVDDNGVGSAKLSSIVADLYAEDMATDPPETLRRVSGDLQTLAERGLIITYEADGKPLLFVTNWKTHQVVNKPSKGHGYPLPTAEMLVQAGQTPGVKPVSATPSGDPPETLRPGAGEQGSRGAGERRSSVASAKPRAAADRKADDNSTAWKLVTKTCRTLTRASQIALKNHVSILLDEGYDSDTITAGLERWLARPDAKPGLLPHLVSDVIRERERGTTAGTNLPKSDQKLMDLAARGERLYREAVARRESQQPPLLAVVDEPKGITAA
ncbi:hypothetical protein [Nocardia asiatica]|uniref:hypothetical protein n=1 Tax=Nocardia asiatica TaxID=209252 RepID=UPI002457D526|nr:hypothetical protein [Nocardia asiatica]